VAHNNYYIFALEDGVFFVPFVTASLMRANGRHYFATILFVVVIVASGSAYGEKDV
jgi:hypothetical protein